MELKTQTITSAAYERIKSDILSGKYKPGQHMREKDLCDELKVSRTPIRDALIRLGQEGLVVLKPHKGVFVRKFTKKNIQDYYQTRAVLEGLGAELATKNITVESKQELSNILRNMKDALHAQKETNDYDDKKIIHINDYFHDYIFTIAGNEILDQMRKTLAHPVALIRVTSWIKEGRRQESLEEHENIIKAILQEDHQKAKECAELHIHNAWRSAERNWDQLPSDEEEI